MRLRLNPDEVPSFLKILREQLENSVAGDDLNLTLGLPREDAERVVATSRNNEMPLELVWASGFRADHKR